MQRPLTRALPILVGAVVVGVLLGHLGSPNSVLVVRDVPIFHLPLRATFAELTTEGLPQWNPKIHGGQPILSNPNYAAFYPPTWLSSLLPAHRALSWSLIAHALFGFGGAWLAARHFGCGRAPATLTALAFTAGGGMLSALNGLTTYCSASWLPWSLFWADRWFNRAEPKLLSRHAALPGLGLAMQVLAGEPAIALASSIAVACLGLTTPRPIVRRISSLVPVAVFAALLSAVQLLPTTTQVQDSARPDQFVEESMVWSTPPLRLAEFALPRLFGDPMGLEEDLYFGWNIHDRGFPYIISIYVGQLALVLALAAFLRWPIPKRAFLITLTGAGLFLALGRFNPVYSLAAPRLPILDLIRYPEKFILLTTTAVSFAAGLGWQHLLDKRKEAGPAREDFAIALAGVLALLILVFGLTLTIRPDVGIWFVRQNTTLDLVNERLTAATEFLTRQVWTGLIASLTALGILVLHRVRRISPTVLVPLTLIGLGGDLLYYNGGLAPAISFAELNRPPNHLEKLDPSTGRVFSDELLVGRGDVIPRTSRPGPDRLWSQADRAEPYLGNLWGYSYALHVDFDRMLTEPARRAFNLVEQHWSQPNLVRRILAAWGVRYWLHNRSAEELTRARYEGRELPAVAVESLSWRAPMLTWVPRVTWHADIEAAEAAAGRSSFRDAHWVGTRSLAIEQGGGPETINQLVAKSASTLLDYASTRPLLAVVNTTYDRGWSARVDGDPSPVHRTALGQIGLELPAGQHVLELEFRTPRLRLGLVLTLLTLILVCGAEWLDQNEARSTHLRTPD